MEQERKINEKQKNKTVLAWERGKEICLRSLSLLGRIGTEISESFWALYQSEQAKSQKKLTRALALSLLFGGIFFSSAAVSLARFPMGVYPAGFALLSSLGGRGIRFGTACEKGQNALEKAVLLTSFSGVLFSLCFMGEGALFYLLAYMILFLTRAGITGGRFDESALARISFSSACSTGVGLILALTDHFSVNRVFGAVSAGILTPLFSFLLSGFYMESHSFALGSSASQKRVYPEAALLTLYYLFLFALKEVNLFGFSLSFVLAVVAMLGMSRSRGAVFGAGVGLIGGMACATPQIAPCLAVGGFFSGLLFSDSSFAAMMIAFVSSCGYAFLSGGFSSFSLVTADFLCGTVLFFPCLPLFQQKRKKAVSAVSGDLFHRETVRRAKEKLKTVSDAFSSLSEVFYTVGTTIKKPGLTETSRMVADCCSQICSRCPLSSVCWGGTERPGENATARIASLLLSEGKVHRSDLPRPFSQDCKEGEQLVERINRRFEEISGNFYKNNKTRLLAGEYSCVSRLLKSTAGELDRELEYNAGLGEQAKKVLQELSIPYRRVAVFGERELKIDVYGVELSQVKASSDQVVQAFGKAFDCVFDAPGFLLLEESAVMRLKRKRGYSLECAKSGCAKRGETVSGDSCLFFETDRDYFYTLICDGMGSGREAALTSRLSSLFIEKLMHCSTPKNVTLEMLNAFLMAKTDETFTSVDLLEIDLLSGHANFIKAGAAPSYVLRGDRLSKIESRTPPAGILRRMCAEQTAFSLREGDYIIQMSDGAEDGSEGTRWLLPLVAGREFENAASLCDQVFAAARERGGWRDDLSVSVIRVMNNK